MVLLHTLDPMFSLALLCNMDLEGVNIGHWVCYHAIHLAYCPIHSKGTGALVT